MTDAKATANIGAMSFEDALKELETIVKRLENGQSTLEQAINDYERGSALKQHCEQRLAAAKLKVEQLVGTESGNPVTEPFDA